VGEGCSAYYSHIRSGDPEINCYRFKPLIEFDFTQPFEKITELTDVAEGTIVRVITRLDETCREVRDAARVIGDAELFRKMEEAQIKIKRDSTYTPLFWFQEPIRCLSFPVF
jgi:hypothetical protein